MQMCVSVCVFSVCVIHSVLCYSGAVSLFMTECVSLFQLCENKAVQRTLVPEHECLSAGAPTIQYGSRVGKSNISPHGNFNSYLYAQRQGGRHGRLRNGAAHAAHAALGSETHVTVCSPAP